MLHHPKLMSTDQVQRRREKYSQELRHRPLQAHHEIYHYTKHRESNERDRDVHNRERDRLREGVVHRALSVSVDDGPLGEEGWDLGHGREGGEEEGAVGRW